MKISHFVIILRCNFVTEASGTTSFQKNRPKIRSNLTWQIEHVLAKVPVKNQFRRRSKSLAETTEREHGA